MFKALRSDSMTLHLIEKENLAEVRALFQGFLDSEEMLDKLQRSYVPRFVDGLRTKYGFYSMIENELAGLCLLGIGSWKDRRGYTGADTLLQMRGKGAAPLSKPHLFYLGFELLRLNRIETGCFASNLASKHSIEKTPGFQLEGVLREYSVNETGAFEDEFRYAILKRDWLRLYDPQKIIVVK